MENLFAKIVLIAWPLIAFFFYKNLNRVSATVLTIVGGYLLLPVNVVFDFPLIPPLGKGAICALAAMAYLRFYRYPALKLIPTNKLERFTVLFILIIPLFTSLGNSEPIYRISGDVTPGLTIYDALSASIRSYLALVPFIIGSQIVKSHDEHVLVFKLIAILTLLYSLLILFEIRMSPQLHSWAYGFFPHSWRQQVRAEGFRPVVFLGHGLLVSMFLALTIGIAATLQRLKIKIQILPMFIIVIYLWIVLLLSKGLGGFLQGTFLLFTVSFFRPSKIATVSLLVASLYLLYPFLSLNSLFPHEAIIEMAASVNPERAHSLEFRFHQESQLLERAYQKPFFGWGGFGRARLDVSVTDGYWILVLGEAGLVGFIALALIQWFPTWRTFRILKYLKNRDEAMLLAGHSIVVSIILIDQLPNASMSPFAWLLIGILSGRTFINRDIQTVSDSGRNSKGHETPDCDNGAGLTQARKKAERE